MFSGAIYGLHSSARGQEWRISYLLTMQILLVPQGPYRVVFGHVMECPPELMPKIPAPYHFRLDRDRRSPDVLRLSGNFTIPFTIDDRLNVRLDQVRCFLEPT